MTESRPPMTPSEFLDGYIPVWIELPNGLTTVPGAWMKGKIVRWVITEPEQQLWSKNVIANDADAWDERIYPYVDDVEVMDIGYNMIYHIKAMDFDRHKYIIEKSGSLQYAVARDHWEKQLLTMWPSLD